jgi:hypothetical protein
MAVDSPEDQRRQPGQGPQLLDGSEQNEAQDYVEDATGKAHTHPETGAAVFL